MQHRAHPLGIFLAIFLFSPTLRAEPPLPYNQRTRPYSGVSTTVRGDIRTVGMAGATIGLGDTFIAASDNPAGLAMTMGTGDFNFTRNWVNDNRPQEYQYSVDTSNFGAAINAYPYGIALGYIAPYSESQPYVVPDAPSVGQIVQLTSRVREMRISGARVFSNNRFSLGASLILGQAETEYAPKDLPDLNTAYHSYSISAALGAMIQLENRVLLGLSYTPPQHYSGDPLLTAPGITQFFQGIEVPARFALGVGWIPNRFFRTDFSIFVLGTTNNTALLKNNEIIVGDKLTVQPRFGAAYILADYKNFSATAFLGTYFEMMRIEGAYSRGHLTGGIETKPWIFTIGWGLDLSPGYNNALVTFGIDVFKVMGKLDLIPTPWRPPYAGFRPSPTGLSDEGLSRPLVKNWQAKGPPIDPIKIGLELPSRIGDKVMDAGEAIGDFTSEIIDSVNPLTSSKKPKSKEVKGNTLPPAPAYESTPSPKSKTKLKQKARRKPKN